MNPLNRMAEWAGWPSGVSPKQFVKDLVRRLEEDECMGYAAQVAFYLLFALFPFLLFLVTLIAYLPTQHLLETIISWLRTFLPENAFRLVAGTVKEVFTDRKQGLLSLSVAASLYSSAQAMLALMTGLNRTLHVEDRRPWWKKGVIAVGGVFGFTGIIITSATLLVFGPRIGFAVAEWAGLGDLFVTTWNILRWPVLLFLLACAVSAMYWLLPATPRRWRLLTPGSGTAIVLWVVATLLFSLYVNRFGTYNKMYGSIGTMIVLMVWMYINALVVLVGSEVDAQMNS